MEQRIPKVIHYVWLGGKPKPKFIESCIATWRNYLPDYEIKEWNESNFDLAAHPFAKEAYDAGKYAFASDYIRVWALYHFGGVYLDTDVEVKCNFSGLLEDARMVGAFELMNSIMTAFIAAQKEHPLLGEILDHYDAIRFIKEDGSYEMTPNPVLFSEKIASYGIAWNGKRQELDEGIRIYPSEVFGAYDVYDMVYHITEDTVLVHHSNASWRSRKEILIMACKRTFIKVFGSRIYSRIRDLKHIVKGGAS